MAPLSPEETRLRHQLGVAVARLRSALTRCPEPAGVSAVGPAEAAAAIAEASSAIDDAGAVTRQLEQLAAASPEAAVLTAATRKALEGADEVVALLSAAIGESFAA